MVRAADIPENVTELDHFFVMLNHNWLMGHDERHRMYEEGVMIEPPKPKKGKQRRNRFTYDDDAPYSQDNTALVIRIKVSSTDLLRNGISALKWVMSQMSANISIDRDQSPQSIMIASISNVPREISEKGLQTTANFYLGMSKEALGRKGKITASQIAGPLPTVHFKFKNQRAIPKDSKDLQKYKINDDPFYRRNGCHWVEIKCNSLHMELVKKILGHFNSHYLSEVFGHHALMHEYAERPTGRDLVLLQRQKKLHVSHLKRLTFYEFRGVTTP